MKLGTYRVDVLAIERPVLTRPAFASISTEKTLAAMEVSVRSFHKTEPDSLSCESFRLSHLRRVWSTLPTFCASPQTRKKLPPHSFPISRSEYPRRSSSP